MRLRPTIPSIDPAKPFDTDKLQREPVAKALTEIAKTAQDGLVVSLHAPWGFGKTTFLEMWRHHLNCEGFRTISFNAWETDITDDALVALIGELDASLKGLGDPAQEKAVDAVLKSAKSIGGKLLRVGLPIAVRLATSGLVDLKSNPGLKDLVEPSLSEWAGKMAEDQIATYVAAKTSMVEFRKKITELAAVVAVKDKDDEKDQKRDKRESSLPLVIIVDELDRCRPTYAVKVLDCIKHLFSVSGVMFVLAVDATQLAHAVRSQYGQKMDADGYLRRFFDLSLRLPVPTASTFCEAQFARFGLDAVFTKRNESPGNRHDRAELSTAFAALFRAFECSYRDQERCFALVSFAFRSIPPGTRLFPSLLAVLIVLKIRAPDTYSAFAQGTKGPVDIIAAIGEGPGGKDFLQTDDGMWLEVICRAAFGNGNEFNSFVSNLRSADGQSPVMASPTRNSKMLNIIENTRVGDISNRRRLLLDRLDLVVPE